MNPQILLEENTELKSEIEHLNAEHQTLTAIHRNLSEEHEKLESEYLNAKAQLEWYRRQLFGKKSEKIIGSDIKQLEFEGFGIQQETKNQEKEKAPRKQRSKSKIRLPADLPIEKEYIDLPEDQKIDENGKPLKKIGEEITSKLAYRPGSYYIKQTIRPKYAKNGSVETAALPETLLDRCQADDSLLTHIIIQKYVDHLPLYRQSEIQKRGGIEIHRKTLCKWVQRAAQALKPLHEELLKQILKSKNIFTDETPVAMLEPGKGKTHQGYMWVIAGGKGPNPPYRTYHYKRSREHKHIYELLQKYQGNLHSDKYGAYEQLAKNSEITWNPCWSHIRRKFFEAEDGALRDKFLTKIRALFAYEKIAWTRDGPERKEIRKQKEIPIIDELIQTAKEALTQNLLPKSSLSKALGYFCSLIPHLKNYTHTEDGRLDNNVAERAIRPLAVGRKNWLFAGSYEGGENAAILLSLVQSCQAIEVNPQEYLEDVMRRINSHNSQKLDELLPDEWAKSRAKAVS